MDRGQCQNSVWINVNWRVGGPKCYIGYTSKFGKLASIYTWQSVMDYDEAYRQMQAAMRFRVGTTANMAWVHYDHDFLTKQEWNPGNSWCAPDMELYARMLRHGTTLIPTKHHQFFVSKWIPATDLTRWLNQSAFFDTLTPKATKVTTDNNKMTESHKAKRYSQGYIYSKRSVQKMLWMTVN